MSLRLCCLLWLTALAGWPAAGQTTSSEPSSTAAQLTLLYRRLLKQTAPQQLLLQDALDITWRGGFLIGPGFQSPRKAIFDGLERHTFSYINAIFNPAQKGERGLGWWVKNNISDVILMHHHGAPVKVHMISDDGKYTTAIFGVALECGYRSAKPQVFVPRSTHSSFESLSQEDFTLHSFLDVPGWNVQDRQNFSPEDMKSRFPEHAELFSSLAEPGFSHDHSCFSDTCRPLSSQCGSSVPAATAMAGGQGRDGYSRGPRSVQMPIPEHLTSSWKNKE